MPKNNLAFYMFCFKTGILNGSIKPVQVTKNDVQKSSSNLNSFYLLILFYIKKIVLRVFHEKFILNQVYLKIENLIDYYVPDHR